MVGGTVLAIGRIEADFHCVGTTDDDSDRFIKAARGAAKNGAPTRRNHAGIPSRPVAVWRSLSRISNVRHSDMRELSSSLFTVFLILGTM